MSGKVEISIDKWDEIRDENSRLKVENEDLKGKSGIVKIIISSKKLMGHFKYDRWKKKNVFIDESQDIEKVEYLNLENVQEIIREEIEEQFKDDLVQKELEIKKLNRKIDDIRKENGTKTAEYIIRRDSELDKVEREHKNEIKEWENLKKKWEKELNAIKSESKKTIQKLEDEIYSLKNDKEEKKNEIKIKDLTEKLTNTESNLNNANVKIEELEKTNMALLKRIPFWKRIK